MTMTMTMVMVIKITVIIVFVIMIIKITRMKAIMMSLYSEVLHCSKMCTKLKYNDN